jgi:dTDP-4-dehydrorhamnose 3,5-epimerase
MSGNCNPKYFVTREASSWKPIISKGFQTSASPMSLFRTTTRVPQKGRCAAFISSCNMRRRSFAAWSKGKLWMWPSISGSDRRPSGNGRACCSPLKKQNQIFIPRGFAHGFLALTDTVQFLYKCSDFCDAASEFGIIWNDPDIGISWGVADPLVSEKDAKLSTLAAMPRESLPLYSQK